MQKIEHSDNNRVMPSKLMKLTESYHELFRREILEGTGIIGPLEAFEELNRLSLFIETMEWYISSSETAEIEQLEAQAQAQTLSPEAKDEFWQWYYPIHWQDIFGVRIRSAFCILLCSQVEATLGDIAHRIHVIERCPAIGNQKKKFKKGSMLERHKSYFNKYAKFESPDEELWRKVGFIFRIRNAHIHFQGFDVKLDEDKEFRHFLDSLPHIGIEHNFIEFKEGSCEEFLEIVYFFQNELIQEYEKYRGKSLVSEKKHK